MKQQNPEEVKEDISEITIIIIIIVLLVIILIRIMLMTMMLEAVMMVMVMIVIMIKQIGLSLCGSMCLSYERQQDRLNLLSTCAFRPVLKEHKYHCIAE